jgi:hypothetical protein
VRVRIAPRARKAPPRRHRHARVAQPAGGTAPRSRAVQVRILLRARSNEYGPVAPIGRAALLHSEGLSVRIRPGPHCRRSSVGEHPPVERRAAGSKPVVDAGRVGRVGRLRLAKPPTGPRSCGGSIPSPSASPSRRGPAGRGASLITRRAQVRVLPARPRPYSSADRAPDYGSGGPRFESSWGHARSSGCGAACRRSRPERDVAQLGSASALGAEGPRFESGYPDKADRCPHGSRAHPVCGSEHHPGGASRQLAPATVPKTVGALPPVAVRPRPPPLRGTRSMRRPPQWKASMSLR